jgi:hypothetical protein
MPDSQEADPIFRCSFLAIAERISGFQSLCGSKLGSTLEDFIPCAVQIAAEALCPRGDTSIVAGKCDT